VPHDLKSFSEFLAKHWEKLVDVAPEVRGATFKSTLSTLYPWSLTFELSWGAKKHTYELFKGLRGKGLPNTMESVSKLVFDELKNRGYSFPPNQPPTIPGTPQPLGLDTLVDQASPRFAWIRMPTVQLDVIGQSEAEAVRQTSVYADFTRFLMERGWGTIEISFEQLFALVFNTSLVVLDQWRGRPLERIELEAEVVEEKGFSEYQLQPANFSVQPPPSVWRKQVLMRGVGKRVDPKRGECVLENASRPRATATSLPLPFPLKTHFFLNSKMGISNFYWIVNYPALTDGASPPRGYGEVGGKIRLDKAISNYRVAQTLWLKINFNIYYDYYVKSLILINLRVSLQY